MKTEAIIILVNAGVNVKAAHGRRDGVRLKAQGARSETFNGKNMQAKQLKMQNLSHADSKLYFSHFCLTPCAASRTPWAFVPLSTNYIFFHVYLKPHSLTLYRSLIPLFLDL